MTNHSFSNFAPYVIILIIRLSPIKLSLLQCTMTIAHSLQALTVLWIIPKAHVSHHRCCANGLTSSASVTYPTLADTQRLGHKGCQTRAIICFMSHYFICKMYWRCWTIIWDKRRRYGSGIGGSGCYTADTRAAFSGMRHGQNTRGMTGRSVGCLSRHCRCGRKVGWKSTTEERGASTWSLERKRKKV